MPCAFASRDLRETHQCEIESRFEMDKALNIYGLKRRKVERLSNACDPNVGF